MTNIEKLIALTWLDKRLGEEIAALRLDVREHYLDRMAHEVDDHDEPRTSFGYYLGDEKLASFWFKRTKAKPERKETVVTCYDWDAALDDDNPDFAAWLGEYVKGHIGELAERYVRETGDMVDGVLAEEVITPGTPAKVDPSAFYVKPNMERIERVMKPQLPSVVAGLLEGGR